MNAETHSTSSGQARACQNCKNSFTIEPEDFGFYEKMQVPPPTWCPECRMMRRMSFWNEHSFFKKLEKRTGKEIFSAYPPEADREIYERDYWWSDAWDPLATGRDIDWNKPFLQQIHELELVAPMPARSILRSVGCEYSNEAADMKNCYLCFNADQSQDCMYGVGMLQVKGSLDLLRAVSCELSYELLGALNCYQCFFATICRDCRNMWLSYDCEDCSDCFGCVNLRHKKYCIFNEQFSKEEYFAKLKEMNLGSYKALTELKKKFDEFGLKFPRKFLTGYRNQNVTGDFVRNSKNAKYCFAVVESENVKYCQSVLMGAKETYDYTNWGNHAEYIYECHSVGEEAQRVKFTCQSFGGVTDIEYSIYCPGSTDLFGCVGLHKKKYCILNKQYSEEEYKALVPKIKKHMDEMPYVDKQGRVYKYGEFFPMEFSPYAVNETVVMDYMDMNKEKALKYGLLWREPNPKEYQTTIKAADLPDHISDVKDEITKEIIGCSGCGKGYRILAAELEFLRRFTIPLPRLCFACRHTARVNLRNKARWYKRSCQKCHIEFETAYPPSDPHIIYCEPCYQAEIV